MSLSALSFMEGIPAVLDTCLVVGGVEKANALNSALPPRSHFPYIYITPFFLVNIISEIHTNDLDVFWLVTLAGMSSQLAIIQL